MVKGEKITLLRSAEDDAPAESPPTTKGAAKADFGRRLKGLLQTRGWNQSDLAREMTRYSDKPVGRDAVSTYINGRSVPTAKNTVVLCKALGISREELFPHDAVMAAVNEDAPTLELKVLNGQPGKALVRVNRVVSFAVATQIVQLINAEDAAGA